MRPNRSWTLVASLGLTGIILLSAVLLSAILSSGCAEKRKEASPPPKQAKSLSKANQNRRLFQLYPNSPTRLLQNHRYDATNRHRISSQNYLQKNPRH